MRSDEPVRIYISKTWRKTVTWNDILLLLANKVDTCNIDLSRIFLEIIANKFAFYCVAISDM